MVILVMVMVMTMIMMTTTMMIILMIIMSFDAAAADDDDDDDNDGDGDDDDNAGDSDDGDGDGDGDDGDGDDGDGDDDAQVLINRTNAHSQHLPLSFCTTANTFHDSSPQETPEPKNSDGVKIVSRGNLTSGSARGSKAAKMRAVARGDDTVSNLKQEQQVWRHRKI